MIEGFRQLLTRLSGYAPVEVAVELLIIWVVIYLVIRFLRGTRGAGIIKGLAVILIVGTLLIRILGQEGEHFQRLTFLYDRALGFAAIALLVVFQPELRRALIRVGETQFFRPGRSEIAPMIEAVIAACEFNSKNKFGLLIAIERSVGLGGLVEGGTPLNADVSPRLLQSIFWPNSALHDLGVVIRNGKVLAAGVQFPLAEIGDLDRSLGARHRAAVGITQETDCIAVVVSEETGDISLSERGRLFKGLTSDELRRLLADRLLQSAWTANESREDVQAASAHAASPAPKSASLMKRDLDAPENAFETDLDDEPGVRTAPEQRSTMKSARVAGDG